MGDRAPVTRMDGSEMPDTLKMLGGSATKNVGL
jgi:hypothetical protein